MKRLWCVIVFFIGLVVCVGVSLSRAPALYNGLWEDEVHYNYVPLHAASFHEMRGNVNWLLRPLLDFSLRKYVWFSRAGFSVTEQSLALVALIYSAVHLVLWLFWPWTPFYTIRLIAILLLGLCSIESIYSAEAQGYSFVSLASSLAFMGFLSGWHRLEKENRNSAFVLLAMALLISLNSHFFSWPLASILSIFSVILLYDLSRENKSCASIKFVVAAGIMIVLLSVFVNKPAILSILNQPPAAKSGWHFELRQSVPYLSQAWDWIGLRWYIYCALAMGGFFHPEKVKRYSFWAGVLTLTLGKLLLVTLMLGKSSYPVFDRYLIMFIGPSIWVLCLGIEASILRLLPYSRSAEPLVGGLMLLVVVYSQRIPLLEIASKSNPGYQKLIHAPQNYSDTYQFFERVKRFQKPTLILSNHCYASDIPKLYTEIIGTPATSFIRTYDTNEHCETPGKTLKSGIGDFLSDHSKDGLVVFFYDANASGLIPCPPSDAFIEQNSNFFCAGIANAQDIAPALAAKIRLIAS